MNIVKIIKSTIEFIYFIIIVLKNRTFFNKIDNNYKGKVAVLANGPSLKSVIPLLNTDKFSSTDFIVVNYFAKDPIFTTIKPKHYCFADPMFFKDTHRSNEAKKIFADINKKVNWNMKIYVPKHFKNKFISFSQINNQNINIVSLSNSYYYGYELFRNFFYKKNIASPPFKNVSIMAIYVAINLGYSNIELYGVDHSFLDSLYVDENNIVSTRVKHFYSENTKITPIINIENGSIYSLSEYLLIIQQTFKSHELLSNYSKYMKVEILNMTKDSMIDSYKKITSI